MSDGGDRTGGVAEPVLATVLRIVADALDVRTIVRDLEQWVLHGTRERQRLRAVTRILSADTDFLDALAPAIPRRERHLLPYATRATEIADKAPGRPAVLRTAADVIAMRAVLGRELAALRWEASVGVLVLAPVPLLGLVLGLAPSWAVPPLSGVLLAAWAAAALLAVLGGLWVWRVGRPPFSSRPADWRAHARLTAAESRLLDVLDDAALLAAAGGPPDIPLEAAQPWPDDATRQMVTSSLRRLSAEVQRASAEGQPAADVVLGEAVAVRRAILTRAQRQWRGYPTALVVPVLACILPAFLLLLIVG
jgi:hypothetical protein